MGSLDRWGESGYTIFYIEDPGGPYDYEQNPYLELQSLRLYEGPFDDLQEHERVYFKAFNAEETRYIYAEVILKIDVFSPIGNASCLLNSTTKHAN